jgi:phage-related tail protein
VPEELKTALAVLQEQTLLLVDQLDDEQSKKDAATAIETIVGESAKSDPTEFLVRAAGDVLIQLGKKVQQHAEAVAHAVTAVYGALKFVARF